MDTVTQTSVLAVTMPKDLAERIKRLAEKNDRTVKAEIRAALREHVERQEDIDPTGNPYRKSLRRPGKPGRRRSAART
jgi:predicted DNA-binding protein